MEGIETMGGNHCAVCLDIGGTAVKSGIVKKDGTLYADSYHHDPIDSGGTADQILSSFAHSLGRLLDYVQEKELRLAGIGIAICGPFDYEKGISKIKDLDKYESIYDVNVKEQLRQRLNLPPGLPMLFDVDAWSFARGEVWVGAGMPYNRVIVFTMGTGVGSAFAVDQKIVSEGAGVPWIGWISGQSYKDGILNDYISRTHMMNRYQALTGNRLDIKEMADEAKAGNKNALRVFEEIGTELGQFLKQHHVEEFGAECILFGGQISKSYELFIGPIKSDLTDIESLRAILPAADIEHSAIKGAAKYVFDAYSIP